MATLVKIFFLTGCLIYTMPVHSQSPAFYHLSTAEGLSDNNVNIAGMDRNGILWIATSEGLNSFDGNSITAYDNYRYPLLASNTIEDIIVSPENKIWIRTNTNRINMMDEKRKFHLFNVGDPADKSRVTQLFYLNSKGIIALKGKKHFRLMNRDAVVFDSIAIPEADQLPDVISLVSKVNNDTLLFYGDHKLVLYDYAHMKIVMTIPLPKIMGITPINADELIAYTQEGNVFYRISISQKKILKEYRHLADQFNQPITGSLRNSTCIGENKIVITSRFGGLYYVDFNKETITHYEHDPFDPKSLGGNNTYRIRFDTTSGYLFVTTLTSGLHYYNTRINQASYKPYFIDDRKEVFDGFIQSVTTAKDGTIWMGAQDRLISWDRKKNKTKYVPCILPGGINLNRKETIRAVQFDGKENLWVGTSTKGVLILNQQLKTIAHLTDTMPNHNNALPSKWINSICPDTHGNMWIATLKGTCMVEKGSFKIISFSQHPVLSKISKIASVSIWIDKESCVWIGTVSGAWRYNELKKTLTQYSTQNGLVHNTIKAMNEDDEGNTYFATTAGLSILSKAGSIKNYNRSNGLRNDLCEGILKDENGFIWIGNLNCIVRYDPAAKKFAVYEERNGFSNGGFRLRFGYKSNTGEMLWGTDKGLAYFYPGQMNSLSSPLLPSINSLLTTDSTFRFTGKETLHFPYESSSFVFLFSAGELTGTRKSQFLYRLKGFDKEWKTPVTTGQVTYSKLTPGTYQFEIKASRDGSVLYDASYPVIIMIDKPWWQQNWFRILCGAFMAAVIYFIYGYFIKRKKAREVQQTIGYFANSGYEHSSVEDILWDICRNCISRLGFEDCVIYLKDDERNVLVQKAAYGPKNPKAFEIVSPIEIPVGKGIVGDVALTAKAGIINDTSKDLRYLVDDEKRLSEITVPLLHEGKVIGVIDSENRKKNFFTPHHLEALQTIALLCSAKISHAMAREAMNKSKIDLMELNVKIAESKFLNLRLQMNPHFLFNSLSSIQHLIVSQQTTKAYKYLTLFSNFLRSLLNFAEKNFIPLDEELKILNLYVQLESLRFDESFTYEINVDESLANDEVLVPSLMVQPFAENAIWHGLLHKEGDKKLSIRFSNHADEFLSCIIEDNGVGRAASASIKQNKISSMVHESKGIQIIKERLSLLQQKTGKPAHVAIEDLYISNEPAGTKVVITIPYYNPEES